MASTLENPGLGTIL